jgi:hypothetical protein
VRDAHHILNPNGLERKKQIANTCLFVVNLPNNVLGLGVQVPLEVKLPFTNDIVTSDSLLIQQLVDKTAFTISVEQELGVPYRVLTQLNWSCVFCRSVLNYAICSHLAQ